MYVFADLEIAIGRHCVVQKYIDHPLLIENYKFDLRIYVLIGSIDPLRIYIYNDGLARFATETYSVAQKGNFKSAYQHLTNYAINKLNPKFKASQSGADLDGGFKRSLKAVFKSLSESGIDTDRLW
jgi:tubulin polyglutamylase TTLL6/13